MVWFLSYRLWINRYEFVRTILSGPMKLTVKVKERKILSGMLIPQLVNVAKVILLCLSFQSEQMMSQYVRNPRAVVACKEIHTSAIR